MNRLEKFSFDQLKNNFEQYQIQLEKTNPRLLHIDNLYLSLIYSDFTLGLTFIKSTLLLFFRSDYLLFNNRNIRGFINRVD